MGNTVDIFLSFEQASRAVKEIAEYVHNNPDYNLNYKFGYVDNGDGKIDIVLNWEENR